MTQFGMQPAVSYPAIVGQVMANVRKERGLDQAACGEMIGLTQSGWSRIERGDVPVTVEQLAMVAHHLGKRPSELLGMADEVVDEARARGFEVRPNRLAQALGAGLVIIGAAALTAMVVRAMAKDIEE